MSQLSELLTNHCEIIDKIYKTYGNNVRNYHSEQIERNDIIRSKYVNVLINAHSECLKTSCKVSVISSLDTSNEEIKESCRLYRDHVVLMGELRDKEIKRSRRVYDEQVALLKELRDERTEALHELYREQSVWLNSYKIDDTDVL